MSFNNTKKNERRMKKNAVCKVKMSKSRLSGGEVRRHSSEFFFIIYFIMQKKEKMNVVSMRNIK